MTSLLGGEVLKRAAQAYAVEALCRIRGEQGGFLSLFDKWFGTVLERLGGIDRATPWEDAVSAACASVPPPEASLAADVERLRLFLDRWLQGRFVPYARRVAAGGSYHPRLGTEFAPEVFLTAQGAPNLLRWRGVPLLKTVFDFALYPMLIDEVRPATVLEIGSGLGGSATWLADHMAMSGIAGLVHSVDLTPPVLTHRGVVFHRGDCATPATLFPPALLASAPHPWLVIEDAHVNVLNVLAHIATYLRPGDRLVVEDSEIKREALAGLDALHPGAFRVDTRYTDFFGRNATCAADAIFVRV